jgi:hypothetical protein
VARPVPLGEIPRYTARWARRAEVVARRERPREYVFVLSHMRSYSTLLCHVLNSNPAIDGYVELHLSYRAPRHLLDLHRGVASSIGHQPTGRYLVDKLLDNSYVIAPDMLLRPDVHTIFSIREPLAAVSSTVAMARQHLPVTNWRRDPVRVAEYYAARLDRLAALARAKDDGRSMYFEADRLLDSTSTVLDRLTRFLDLDVPLTEEYETHEMTGRAELGDPSPVIRAGRILRERDSDDLAVDLDVALGEREHRLVLDAYERARSRLADECLVVA